MTLLIAGLAWFALALVAARAVGPLLRGAGERTTGSTTF
jgi:hypothetical protein